MALALASPARSGSKGFYRGTHRACPPEETWARIAPLLAAAGITRTAELTRLDGAGVPVAQAIRPASHSLTVTLGAGLTPVLARVAAAMAALELWHAERVGAAPEWASVGAVRGELGYDPYALPLARPNLLNDGMVLDWVPATLLATGRSTVVPRACVEHDLSVREEWSPPVFAATRDGLAAGNTHAEAVLHGLCELIARDAAARTAAAPHGEVPRLDTATVDAEDPRRLLERLLAAGLTATVRDLTGPSRVPVFEATLASAEAPRRARGVGCHPDRGVALTRALLAAARERLALLSGARDDLPLDGSPGLPPSPPPNGSPVRFWHEVPSLGTASFAGDIAEVAMRLRRAGAGTVLVVDLSRDGVGLPVARVIAPDLRHDGST